MTDWKALWKSNQLSKCELPKLKEYLKSVGLPMNGNNSDVVQRVQMHLDVTHSDLFVTHNNAKKTPYDLSLPELRKMVAQLGSDPSGSKDELHFALIEHLKSKTGGTKKDPAAGPSSGSAGSANKGVLIAKQILLMKDDYNAILSASGTNITAESSVASMRKAYLTLSLVIHPDKLEKEFPEATKAFQYLVNAYERLSMPEMFEEEAEEKKKKDKKVMRSNEGCFRTRVFCPRCRGEWGLPDSGVEAYDYNFLMMGLKTFNCAGCLLEFGCMTAIQHCPFCRKPFDYHPQDYHRKLTCGNGSCKKAFGFMIFNISERMEKEYRAEIRRKQEKQLKEKEQLAERSKRAKSRGAEVGQSGKAQLFILNLLDECPKCGEEVESNQELRETHLNECTDKRKIAAYAKKLKDEEETAEKKQKLKAAEEEARNLAAWEYSGGKITDLWLLTEKQLEALCVQYALPVDGGKDELISRIVTHRNALDSKRMLTQGEGGDEGRPRKKAKISVEDLPSNMEAMSVGQLKAVAASFGINVAGKKTKAGIINEIERLAHGDQPFLQLTDGTKKK